VTPRLAALDVGGPVGPWSDLGFAVRGQRADVGGVALRFHPGEPPGLRGWAFHGVPAGTELDGVPCGEAPPAGAGPVHPNGAEALDHVVVMTPALQRSLDALTATGLQVRRVREAGGGARQAFLVAGTALLEVVGDVEPPTRLWGVTFVVADVDALAAARPGALGRPRAAVQPGRRIVTVREEAGLGVPVAFMTPRRGG
jgi:hypothetical protein